MRKLLFLLFFCSHALLYAQDHMNLTLLSHWKDPNLHKVDGDQVWSDVIGWKDTVKNKEYLIAGSTDSMYFFNITDPTQMIKCDVKEGHSRNAINRDYDIYDHYLYCVSDRSSPLGSLQIFDMQYLPDSVHLVYDDDTYSINTHTIFIEAARKRMYLCGTTHKPAGTWSMGIFSLEDPLHPAFLGELDKNICDYTHEVFTKNDTAYCSCGNSGLFIFDLTDMEHMSLISSITPPYVENGYNHSSWLDSTGKYLMFTDENQGLGIKIYDLHDIRNPDFLTVWNSHDNALPHNAYWNGRWAVASSYEDGVYIYDLKNIESYTPFQAPPTAAYYDTYPLNPAGTYNGFHGCWGVWPFLPSGNILASDISEGLFVLQASPTLATKETEDVLMYAGISPNPFQSGTSLSLQSRSREKASIRVIDITGRTVFSNVLQLEAGSNTIELGSDLASGGVYFLTVNAGTSSISRKLIKQ